MPAPATARDSARLVDHDVAEISTPLLIFVESLPRIEKRDRCAARKHSRVAARREEIPRAQELLRLAEHELEVEDRAVRVRGAASDARALEARDGGRDDDPLDRRPCLLELLDLVDV